MYFSVGTIIAAAAFFSATSAAPAPGVDPSTGAQKPPFRSVVNHLDSNNKIHWLPAPNGGRYATIPTSDVDSAHKVLQGRSLDLQVRGGTDAAVGGWTNAGQIMNLAASYACEETGEWGVSSTIQTGATEACSKLLALAPGAVQAESAWNLFQSASNADDSGGQFNTIYRFFYNTSKAPKLTEQICSSVIQKLTSDFCQGKKDKGADTRGGEMKIGDGDDYLMIGIDPNEA